MSLLSSLRPRWKWIAAGAVFLAVTLTLITTATRAMVSSPDESRPFFEVQSGPLTISVSVTGTIKALDQEVITNEVEGQTTILYIIPEGSQVKEGDLLVELDASKLQDGLVDQEIRTQNAEASFVNARESFEVVKNQAQSDVDKAELAYRFAQEDRQKFLDGDFPLQARQAESKVTLARGDMKRAQEKVEGSRRLAERNFITSMDLDADEQSALKSELDLQIAEEQQKLLHDFEYKRQLAQLESDEDQARMALERVKRKASADVVQAEADLKAKELEHKREQSKLDKVKEQLEKTKLYAPSAGLVVYATTGQGSFRGNQEPLAEGQTVRERQEIIYLPTTDAYKAEVKVHESSLAKVRPDLPVTLAVEALPGHVYEGRVETIAPLPDAQSVWMNPDLKVYNTDIKITGATDGLRTGMSCRGEILVKEFDNALYVPVQSVVRESGTPTAYVLKNSKVERRAVALGLDNNRMVQIESGLKPGELVLLAPPLAADEMEQRTSLPRAEGTAGAGTGASAPAGEPAASPDTTPAPSAPAPSAERGPGSDAPTPDAARPQGEGPGGSDRGGMRSRFQNATPEEREQMRKQWEERLQNMTPEERQRMEERMQQRQRGGSDREGQPRPE
ncbi:MAG: efflux RND transporter periplasmic adaptor subunit [Candidatus Hydrogenedentes bacterium]|nr:efflux RND transporter periplasmic adaptor subunit [Candidatus Hydrogenedentota bacterium]